MRLQQNESGREPTTDSAPFIRLFIASGPPGKLLSPRFNRQIGTRRDAYSIILFDSTTQNAVVNDFTSTPDQLLDIVLNVKASGNTNFTAALRAGQATMMDNWSTERFVFLSISRFCLAVSVQFAEHLSWFSSQMGNARYMRRLS